MRMRLTVAATLLLVLAAHPVTATQHLQPLVLGWEQFFKITWQASERKGQPVVDGYIVNEAGFAATKVRLLVEGLDGSGRVVDQRVEWLGTSLTPGTRAYFEVTMPQKSASYRVSVFAYDWVQAASLGPQAP